ncbi:hypothetical protein ACLOJK_034583 [Asimina triloba]
MAARGRKRERRKRSKGIMFLGRGRGGAAATLVFDEMQRGKQGQGGYFCFGVARFSSPSRSLVIPPPIFLFALFPLSQALLKYVTVLAELAWYCAE